MPRAKVRAISTQTLYASRSRDPEVGQSRSALLRPMCSLGIAIIFKGIMPYNDQRAATEVLGSTRENVGV